MTDKRETLRRLSVTVVTVMLTACTSSPEVRELAEKTAANTATLSSAIDSMSQQSRRLAERRAANAARLAAATARVESRMALDKALLEQSGDTRPQATFRKLETWSNSVREIDAKVVIDEAGLVRRMLADRGAIESRAKALSEVAGILATLAKEKKLQDRAIFLLNYGKEVYEQVRKKQKEAEGAVRAGSAKLVAGEAQRDDRPSN